MHNFPSCAPGCKDHDSDAFRIEKEIEIDFATLEASGYNIAAAAMRDLDSFICCPKCQSHPSHVTNNNKATSSGPSSGLNAAAAACAAAALLPPGTKKPSTSAALNYIQCHGPGGVGAVSNCFMGHKHPNHRVNHHQVKMRLKEKSKKKLEEKSACLSGSSSFVQETITTTTTTSFSRIQDQMATTATVQDSSLTMEFLGASLNMNPMGSGPIHSEHIHHFHHSQQNVPINSTQTASNTSGTLLSPSSLNNTGTRGESSGTSPSRNSSNHHTTTNIANAKSQQQQRNSKSKSSHYHGHHQEECCTKKDDCHCAACIKRQKIAEELIAEEESSKKKKQKKKKNKSNKHNKQSSTTTGDAVLFSEETSKPEEVRKVGETEKVVEQEDDEETQPVIIMTISKSKSPTVTPPSPTSQQQQQSSTSSKSSSKKSKKNKQQQQQVVIENEIITTSNSLKTMTMNDEDDKKSPSNNNNNNNTKENSNLSQDSNGDSTSVDIQQWIKVKNKNKQQQQTSSCGVNANSPNNTNTNNNIVLDTWPSSSGHLIEDTLDADDLNDCGGDDDCLDQDSHIQSGGFKVIQSDKSRKSQQQQQQFSNQYNNCNDNDNLGSSLTNSHNNNNDGSGCLNSRITSANPIGMAPKAKLMAIEAQIAYNNNELKGAVQYISEALELDPRNPIYYINRAFYHERLNEYEHALKDTESALRFDESKDHIDHALCLKAKALIGLEQYEQAEQFLSKIRTLPHKPRVIPFLEKDLLLLRMKKLVSCSYTLPLARIYAARFPTISDSLSAIERNCQLLLERKLNESDPKLHLWLIHRQQQQNSSFDIGASILDFFDEKSASKMRFWESESQKFSMVNHLDYDDDELYFSDEEERHTWYSHPNNWHRPKDILKKHPIQFEDTKEPPNSKGQKALWIGNVSPTCSLTFVTNLFMKFGNVTFCKIFSNEQRTTGDVAYLLLHYDNDISPRLVMSYFKDKIVPGISKNDSCPLLIRFRNKNDKIDETGGSTDNFTGGSSNGSSVSGQSGSNGGSNSPSSKTISECYYYRTTGCDRQHCTFRHVPGNKGIDKQTWMRKKN